MALCFSSDQENPGKMQLPYPFRHSALSHLSLPQGPSLNPRWKLGLQALTDHVVWQVENRQALDGG